MEASATQSLTIKYNGTLSSFCYNLFGCSGGVTTGSTPTIINTHGVTFTGNTYYKAPGQIDSITVTINYDDLKGPFPGVYSTIFEKDKQ